jgi:antitoxin ParD1/3/4
MTAVASLLRYVFCAAGGDRSFLSRAYLRSDNLPLEIWLQSKLVLHENVVIAGGLLPPLSNGIMAVLQYGSRPMPNNPSITLDDHSSEFVAREITAGRYSSASDVVSAGLRLLETEEEKLIALRSALEDGEASGIAEGDAFERVRGQLGLESQ